MKWPAQTTVVTLSAHVEVHCSRSILEAVAEALPRAPGAKGPVVVADKALDMALGKHPKWLSIGANISFIHGQY